MKKALLALLMALCILCMSGCSQITESVLNIVADNAGESGADALSRQFIDGLLTNDPQKSRSAFVEAVTLEQVLQVFPAMQDMLPDADTYTLTPVSWNTKASNGVTQSAFEFQLVMGEQTFLVQTLQLSSMEGLYNIHIAPYTAQESSETSVYETPVIDTLFLLISVATAVFVIWALVDCCRHKLRRKWLMILLILLGNILFVLSLNGTQMGFNLHLGLHLNATSLTLREDGFYLRLLFPVGSIVYLLRRKHLLIPPAQPGFAEAFAADSVPASSENDQET